MKRRKFIATSALASAIPFSKVKGEELAYDDQNEKDRELYELRKYEIKFGGRKQLLIQYLKEVLKPTLNEIGANNFLMFEDFGMSNPSKIWVLISFPDSASYLKSQMIFEDPDYLTKAKVYDAIPKDQTIFNRYETSLLHAFSGLPQMDGNVSESSIFELRTYEGYSEDAVKRKIEMFNKEELTLFYKVGLHPVFFAKMMAGPHLPCLVYLLHFKDMEERDANWAKFVNHDDWKEMRSKPEYADSVSNIRREFLTPIG
jgi:hypothetical protein